MSKPDVIETIGGFNFTWHEEQICIKVSRLQVHPTDGRVSGEIIIMALRKDEEENLIYMPIYPQTTYTFTNANARKSLAKALEEMDSRGWGDILNQLSLGVVERARQGEPIEELWTGQDVTPPRFLLEPLLYEGLPTIMFGEKAVCKSTIATAIYSTLMLNWTDNPLGWKIPFDINEAVIVLYLNWEVDGYITQWYADRFVRGMDIANFPIFHRRCRLPLVNEIEEIKKLIDQVRAQVLIIDSLGPAVGDNLSDPGQALRFNTALATLGCCSLIIGQTSKGPEGKKSVFGSTYFEYYARNIWEIRKVQQEGEDDLDIAMYNTYHNLGRKFKPMGYHVSFGQDTTTILKSEITATDLVKRLSTQAQIEKSLKDNPLKIKELVETLDAKENTVRSALRRMEKAGRVVQLSDKSFGLTSNLL